MRSDIASAACHENGHVLSLTELRKANGSRQSEGPGPPRAAFQQPTDHFSEFRCSVLDGVGVMNRTVLVFRTLALCQVSFGTITPVPGTSTTDHWRSPSSSRNSTSP